MKYLIKALIISFFLIQFSYFSNNVYSQIIFDSTSNFYELTEYCDDYYDSIINIVGAENMEGTGYKHYVHWKTEWEPLVQPSGDFLPYFQAIESSWDCYDDIGYFDSYGTWDEIGPTTSSQSDCNTDDVGRLSCITVDPQNDNIILTGSPVGGLYYTEDYGETWINGGLDHPKEDHELEMFTPGIASIEIIHDAGTTWWYIATGDKDNNFNFSRGVLRTKDKGLNWEQVNNGFDIGIWNFIRKIIVHPDNPNYIFAATSKGIYRTANALENNPLNVIWTKVLEETNSNKVGFFDIEFSHHDPQQRKILAVKEFLFGITSTDPYYSNIGDGNEVFWSQDPYGNFGTWEEMPNSNQILPAIGDQYHKFRIMIETTPHDPDIAIAYLMASNSPSGQVSGNYTKFYKYSFLSESWTYLSDPIGTPNYGRTAFAVSQDNSDILYYGFVRPYCSDDGGVTWTKHHDTETINGESKNFPHSDIHEIAFTNNGYSIWAATDGGPYISEVGYLNDWENKVNDIGIAIVHYFDQSKIDPNFYVFGGYDVHSQLFHRSVLGDKWTDAGAGDGYGCAMDNEELGTFYVTNQFVIEKYKNWEYDFYTSYGNYWNRHVKINTWYNNILYMSLKTEIAKSIDQGANWTPIAELYNDFGFTDDQHHLYDMHTAEADPNYLYLRMLKRQNGEHPRIYKTINADIADPNWTEISPDPSPLGWIGDIIVDYENPDRFWVPYKNSNNGDEIWEYTGGIWIDRTYNLDELSCNVGISSLEHLHGTNYGLFAGGNHGVFYLEDNTQEWKLYKPGIPNVSKPYMKINYCSGKLVVGSRGRGLWETDLPIGWNYPIFLTNDESWDGYQVITAPVHIQQGVTLTITGKVAFSSSGGIVVERGGQLILDNAYLTNTCGELWAGIQVLGNPTQPPVTEYQGKVKIINETIIEHAELAVVNCLMVEDITDGDLFPDLSFAGGIVEANDAYFKNNKNASTFYKYPANGYTYPSNCSFTNCQFITDDHYEGIENPKYFVRLNELNKIDFTYCQFRNLTGEDHTGSGIYSFSSHFSIDGILETFWFKSRFDNLNYGIYVLGSGIDYADIRHCDFYNNFRGCYIGGLDQFRVTSNSFNINELWETGGGYGLYLDNANGFRVEENEFIGNIDGEGVGIIANDCFRGANEIYRNSFTRLQCGIEAQNENRQKDGIGLVLKCNDYLSTDFDEVIPFEGQFIGARFGLAGNQGYYDQQYPQPEHMAGNLFCDNGEINGDFDDMKNQANDFNYYYPQNYNLFYYNVVPKDFTELTINDFPVFIPGGIQWTYENGCPPTEETGGGGSGEEEMKSVISETQLKIDSTENLLSLLIDGGDTEELQTDVDNSIPPDTYEVYNELMQKSPYLSDTVISTAIEKENVLPNAMIRDIMVANPHTAKSNELMNKLDERWDPLPEYMKAQILQGKSIVSIKEQLESELAAYKQQKAKVFNGVVNWFLNDTLDLNASSDSLLLLFQQDNRLSSKYILAMLHLEKGDLQIALDVLNGIPTHFGLQDDDLTNHQEMVSYCNMLVDLANEDKSVLDVDSVQLNQLLAMEATQQGQASIYARNILLALNEIEYEEPILLPDLLKSAKAFEEYQELMNVEPPRQIEVYPNPSDNYVIISYKLEMDKPDYSIRITDLNGKTVRTVDIVNWQDQIVIDTQKWKPGVYISTLEINSIPVESAKFTIL